MGVGQILNAGRKLGSKARKGLEEVHSDPESPGLPAEQQGEKMSSFFRSLGSKKKSKLSLALSEGSEWGGNTTGGSWPSEQRRLDPGKEEERRRQAAAAEERGEKLERENNLLRLKVEILLDMLAQKTAETSLQDSEILRLRESLDLESLNCQPVRLV